MLLSKEKNMKTLKRFGAVLVLVSLFSVAALAGEMQTPPCAPPGETSGPPCVAPGETHGPPLAEVVEIGLALALELALF